MKITFDQMSNSSDSSSQLWSAWTSLTDSRGSQKRGSLSECRSEEQHDCAWCPSDGISWLFRSCKCLLDDIDVIYAIFHDYPTRSGWSLIVERALCPCRVFGSGLRRIIAPGGSRFREIASHQRSHAWLRSNRCCEGRSGESLSWSCIMRRCLAVRCSRRCHTGMIHSKLSRVVHLR